MHLLSIIQPKLLLFNFLLLLLIKGLVHPKMKILSVITLMLFKPLKTFVCLQNTN